MLLCPPLVIKHVEEEVEHACRPTEPPRSERGHEDEMLHPSASHSLVNQSNGAVTVNPLRVFEVELVLWGTEAANHDVCAAHTTLQGLLALQIERLKGNVSKLVLSFTIITTTTDEATEGFFELLRASAPALDLKSSLRELLNHSQARSTRCATNVNALWTTLQFLLFLFPFFALDRDSRRRRPRSSLFSSAATSSSSALTQSNHPLRRRS
mmetsp:Transcript_13261/g.25249  ORF Transcript_13261/g.25249 Transcript_13261/m.25249 type:complete len:211 (+) Transcript_13261:1107-1739(+)